MPWGAAPLGCLEGEAPLTGETEGVLRTALGVTPTAAIYDTAGWHECAHGTHTLGQTVSVIHKSR